jgi:hypothetical protein
MKRGDIVPQLIDSSPSHRAHADPIMSAITRRRCEGRAWKERDNFMPENDYDPMPQSWREAFHKALLRTDDWLRHSGPEPEVYLDETPMAAQTLFHLMTKFDQDRMRDMEIQLTYEILGGSPTVRYHLQPIVWQSGQISRASDRRAKS